MKKEQEEGTGVDVLGRLRQAEDLGMSIVGLGMHYSDILAEVEHLLHVADIPPSVSMTPIEL